MSDQPLKYNDDGTITCSVVGKSYRLRRPSMGEMRALWEAWDHAADDTRDTIDANAERLGELADVANDETADRSERSAARAEHRESNKKMRVDNEAVWASWMREVFSVLATPDLPEVEGDDPAIGLEPWMVTPTVGPEFRAHWQDRPKASGDEASRLAEMIRLMGTLSAQ